MRGTDKVTELRKIRGRAIALVGRPAIDEPFTLIKSEDGTPDQTTGNPVAINLEELFETFGSMLKKELDLFKQAFSPVPASNLPFTENVTDPKRDEMLKSLKDLAKSSTEMLKPQREQLSVVCKYHGVEGPEITGDEDPQVSPAMQSMMSKMDSTINAINQLAAAIQLQAKPATPATVTKTEESPADDAALKSLMEESKAAKKAMAMIAWKMEKALGKDPGPMPE